MTEDEMVGWHHQLNGHEFRWTPGVDDGQGAYCSPTRGVAKSGTTERLSTARNYNMCESVSHPWPPKGL